MEKRSIPINSVSYTAALQHRIPYVTQSHRAKALIQLPDATKLSINSCRTTVSIRTYLDHFPDYCNMIEKECPWMSYSTIAYYSNISWSDKQPLCRCWRRPSELFLQVRALSIKDAAGCLQLSWLAGFSCAWAMISVYDFRVFMISCQISSTEPMQASWSLDGHVEISEVPVCGGNSLDLRGAARVDGKPPATFWKHHHRHQFLQRFTSFYKILTSCVWPWNPLKSDTAMISKRLYGLAMHNGWMPTYSIEQIMIQYGRLMAEILHHLGCKNPINNGINYLSTGAGFQPSTVWYNQCRYGRTLVIIGVQANKNKIKKSASCLCIL